MIFEHFASDIVDDVYRLIREEFRSSLPLVNEIMDQVLSVRGKGVRPLFMYHVSRLNGGGWEQLRRASMVIEAIHVASLLHDDVVDGSELRRGTATLNRRYSDKVSVLFGDYLFMTALNRSHDLGNPAVASIVQNAVTRMVEGEIADSLYTGWIDEETYLSIIGNKTASLFSAAGEIGMMLAGGDEDACIRARELGECVGLAFQIVDDALDYRGEADLMGKPTFMDVSSGCLTLPLIHALRDLDQDTVKNLLREDSRTTERLLAAVKDSRGVEYALERAAEFASRGRTILHSWPEGESRTLFDAFFDALLDRRF